jgi:PPOX class probable FMN-dependent enzyme
MLGPQRLKQTVAVERITTEEQLTALLGEPLKRVADKVRTRLGDLDRQWLAASPFWIVATSGPNGSCDVSPKGDPRGSVLVLDESTLVIAERPGNRRADGYRNILANPHVGLLFVVPGRGDTLRINGRAELVSEAPFLDEMIVKEHRPSLALVVHVEEVFFHCSKAFLRSQLWDPATWSPDDVPPRNQIAHALERPDEPIEVLEAYYAASYTDSLYRD